MGDEIEHHSSEMFTKDIELIGETIPMADIGDNIIAKEDKFRTVNFRLLLFPSVQNCGSYSKSPLVTYGGSGMGGRGRGNEGRGKGRWESYLPIYLVWGKSQ